MVVKSGNTGNAFEKSIEQGSKCFTIGKFTVCLTSSPTRWHSSNTYLPPRGLVVRASVS